MTVRDVTEGLKGFQRRTVDYVFRRMYEDRDPATRFLVADEVGLGKTLVARGVIARAIEYLQAKGISRIDVIYICANAEIAAQNIRRLNVTGDGAVSRVTRITLLPRELRHLTVNPVNFVSFTPGTSFSMASKTGQSEERAVLFRLLEYALSEALNERPGAYRVLRGGQLDHNFRWAVERTGRVGQLDGGGLDRGLADAFKAELCARPDLVARFRRLVDTEEDRDDRSEREDVILELRRTLARSCVQALEPDLVILDEFQRFRELLAEPKRDDPDDIRNLAHDLFRQDGVRTLLLSATPYKMYTLRDEEQDDHYGDFLNTARFLMGEEETRGLEDDLKAFRQALLNAGSAGQRVLLERKHRIERRLRRYMARTERLSLTGDRSGMIEQRQLSEARLTPADLRSYAVADRVSRLLTAGDMIDYWKSSPYLLNFMSDYKVKRDLREAASGVRGAELASAIDPSTLFPPERAAAYERLESGNPRLRGLAAETVDAGAWRLLWLPPSLPYYRGGGAYVDPALAAATKRLIFSSWNVVPDAISVMLSYEAERQMMRSRDPTARNHPEDRARLRGLLAIRRHEGKPAGMSTFGLLYPCATLAEIADPFAIAKDLGAATREIDLAEVVEEATRRIGEALAPMTRRAPVDGPEDRSWYWAAPLLLDRRRWPREETGRWLATSSVVRAPGASDGAGEDDAGAWADHVELARRILGGSERLGRVPADLAESTALLALGAPGTCALRAIARALDRGGASRQMLLNLAVRDAALVVAWGFRSLFNVPEVMSLLRGSAGAEDAYWRRVAEEGVNGNLQAVLDEYLHLLPESLGLIDRDPRTSAEILGRAVHDVVAIRAVTYHFDDVRVDGSNVRFEPLQMRVRFALRFGRDVVDDQKALQRSSVVRSAFNSPFWPFVLTSTSVGQEGLDFHQYCHAVVHWNLPANPVDLEQREGRVHRYKGHAIRKNVAARHRAAAFGRRVSEPWAAMFAEAVQGARRGRLRDMEPFWVYEGPARIERQIPFLPLSRDLEHLARLRRSLAAYRLVFGQPRQEDLVEYLRERVSSEDLARLVEELRIDLTPR